MLIENMPIIEGNGAKNGSVARLKEHILAILIIGDINHAKEIRAELKEIIGVIENAIYRNKVSPH